MASVNKVILLGTLGRDPEVRFSANQLPIESLSLATSSFRRSAESQDRIEETEWHRVTLFGRQAEIAQQYLRKGSRAYIEGRLRTRKYEKDGQTHYVTEIVAEQLQLIDRRQDSPADGNFSDGNSGYAPSRSASRSSGYSSGNQYASQPKTQNAFDDEEPPF